MGWMVPISLFASSIRTNRRSDVLRVNHTLPVRLHIGDGEALLFQCTHTVQDCVMLKCCGNQVLFAFGCTCQSSAFHSPVIRLAAACREKDFVGLGIQRSGYLCPGTVQQLLGFVANAVMAGGVAVSVCQNVCHSFCHPFIAGGGSCVIKINQVLHRYSPFRFNIIVLQWDISCEYIILTC